MRRATMLALALVACEAVSAAEQEGVVVLESGGVVGGKISATGDRYLITRPNSVVDVPAAQVRIVADSLEDAYWRQREQLPRNTTEAHLQLAEWCLRHELLRPAAQELADARRLDPRDPRVELLERRLAVASRPKASRPAVSPVTIPDMTPAPDELSALEASAAELPAGVVERFTRKVQPLLVNSCTASGCHQPSGREKYQLDRAVLYGLSNRRTTLRNLAATLELVDRDSPQQSLLLSIPRRSHGGMNRPIFSPRQEEQFLQLVDWVAMVTETDTFAEAVPAAADVGDEARLPKKQPAFADAHVTRANYEEAPSNALAPQLRRGAEIVPWQPKDAFDPEIFNRRSAKAAAATPEASNSRPSATR